ncbi:MAG TPA: S9 family peptidase [Gemmatimonadales bacterium]|nr:S9 family peptidase [Gemmatimonadales bacterium]
MAAVALVPRPDLLETREPPRAPRNPRVDTLHGEVREDPYFWLRDRSDPAVVAYLEAENAWAEAGMRHTAELQARLYQEMLGRVQETDVTVPYRHGAWWYYSRTETGRSYPIYCRKRENLEAPEEVYLDQNALAEGQAFHALGGMDVSPDGRFLLYLEDLTGSREYLLSVKDLATGAVVDRIEQVWNGTAWAEDSRTFFYVTADAAKRGHAVWRHVVGTPRDRDTLVFREDDVLYHVSLQRSRSGKYVLIASEAFTSSEWRVIPTARPTEEPRVIASRRPGVEYSVEHGEGWFYVYTNDGATNFKIVRAPEHQPGPEHWEEWLPHRDDVFIEGLDVFQRHAVVMERAHGLRRLRVVDLEDGAGHDVTFPEPAYGVFPAANPEFHTEVYRFTYSSLVTPASVFDYNLRTGVRELKKRQEIPSGFDPDRYEVHRFMAPARDGARVPVSVLLRRGTALDGSAAALLYGYGAYGITAEPTFDANVLSLVDRGMVYAIAHVRGGQELGRRWYDDGKMLRKKNSFFDFIDVALELIRRGYARPERLVAMGGSAGGLLVAAVANLRPDLFRAIVADVPFVDVINTMLDASLPLTAQEWEQWGDPRDPEHYAYMRSYSPYDNVEAKAYPWMLVTTALNDSQVMYWEPAKWVARLRALKTDRNPLYLKTNMAAGHTGASGRYDRLKEIAFRYAFVLDAVGLAG